MDRLSVERTIDRPSRAPIRLPHGADSRSPAPAAPAPVFGDRVTLHEDALGAFDLRAATERSLELVKFGEAAQDDVDRALPVLDVVIADLGKHATLGRFFDEAGIGSVQENYDRAGGFADDLVDQLKRMLRALSQTDQRDIGSLAGGDRADVLNVDLTGDHLVTKGDHDRRDQRQAILSLVSDQDAKMLRRAGVRDAIHQPNSKSPAAHFGRLGRALRGRGYDQ